MGGPPDSIYVSGVVGCDALGASEWKSLRFIEQGKYSKYSKALLDYWGLLLLHDNAATFATRYDSVPSS